MNPRVIDDLLYFTQIFYFLRTNRKFEIPFPPGRQSHYKIITDALMRVFDGKTKRLIINVPPRYGKTEMLIHFVAWSLAQYPDSNFLYISYAHTLAKKQTQTIRSILEMKEYKEVFDVHIKSDVSAKDNFETTHGGSVYAAGAAGTITGRGAGISNCERFGGCIVVDDIHKPDEVTSDTIRESINDWYYSTLQSRLNSPNTPIIFIGQRLHEDDLAANLIKTGEWEKVILPSLDEAGNALDPTKHSVSMLMNMKRDMPYHFAAQYQQDPQPAGGGVFKKDWFVLHDVEPEILATFITVDTAETNKNYNDATVFSFFGIYKIKHGEIETDDYAIHWIDCHECHIEPKDLMTEFMSFYQGTLRHKVKPKLVAIERKSTGVTLLSTLKEFQGLQIHDIERTKASGSKTERFLEIQPFVARGFISLPRYGRHTHLCITQCSKITANDSHRSDDVVDTLYDAVKLALIDEYVINKHEKKTDYDAIAKDLMSHSNRLDRLRKSAFER